MIDLNTNYEFSVNLPLEREKKKMHNNKIINSKIQKLK